MGEVYWGAWQRNGDGLVELLGSEAVLAPQQIMIPAPESLLARPSAAGAEPAPDWIAVGEGWLAYREPLLAAVAQSGSRVELMDQPLYPAARHLMELGVAAWRRGESLPAEQAVPVYLRNKVV